MKTRVKKLDNLPSNLENDFYKNWFRKADYSFDSNFQWKVVSEAPSEDGKHIWKKQIW